MAKSDAKQLNDKLTLLKSSPTHEQAVDDFKNYSPITKINILTSLNIQLLEQNIILTLPISL